MIHEQVQKQLEYLKALVDAELKNEEMYKKWGVPYTPSRRKWINIEEYERYQHEVDRNGDKNLLVMVKLTGKYGINMYGIYPFARRYVDSEYLVHQTEYGTEILLTEDEAIIIKQND